MQPHSNPLAELAVQLKNFVDRATVVWESYQADGPGRVDGALFDQIETPSGAIARLLKDPKILQAARQLSGDDTNEWIDEICVAIERVYDLTYRCAKRPEGLCFITGEAGLIPRRDWHVAMEDSLRLVSEQSAAIASAAEITR